MKERTGCVFSISKENQPVSGCTISKAVSQEHGYDISYFSLAAHTSISPESYAYPKLMIVADGTAEVFTMNGDRWTLNPGDAFLTPMDIPVGIETESACIYTEITLKKESNMNDVMKAGEVFSLKDLVPVQEGKIVNLDLVRDDKMKFVIMSFAEGTGLSEHAAPGEALIFALEGKGIIGYEGKEYSIQAGENFKFAKDGKHYVKADGPFKMALLLIFG